VVRPQRPGAIAPRVVQVHDEATAVLAQRVRAQESLAVPNGVGVVAALGERRGEALEGLEVELAQALALVERSASGSAWRSA
jgi:hypothetical protein